jgi:hypothetical protein
LKKTWLMMAIVAAGILFPVAGRTEVIDGSTTIGAGATVGSPQPVSQPQTMADLVNTVEWLYIQVANLQAALSNQQQQLSTIEKNPVLTLGQYMTYTPATKKSNALELFSGVNIRITKGLFQAN